MKLSRKQHKDLARILTVAGIFSKTLMEDSDYGQDKEFTKKVNKLNKSIKRTSALFFSKPSFSEPPVEGIENFDQLPKEVQEVVRALQNCGAKIGGIKKIAIQTTND